MNLVKAYTQATIAAVAELANGWLPPQNFSAVSGTDKVTLSWDLMPETSKYKVYKDGMLLMETTTNSYIDNNVVLGEKYAYFVKGIRAGSNEESLPSNVDSIVFTSPLTIPYSLDVVGDKEELTYWYYKDWRVGTWQGGRKYLHVAQRNFSIMELDWFPIPENTTDLSLRIAALGASEPNPMQSLHVFYEAIL